MNEPQRKAGSADSGNEPDHETRHRELERRVALLERQVRQLMARLTEDELALGERVDGD